MKKAIISLLFSAVLCLAMPTVQANAAEATTYTSTAVLDMSEEVLVQASDIPADVNASAITIVPNAFTIGERTYVYVTYKATGEESSITTAYLGDTRLSYLSSYSTGLNRTYYFSVEKFTGTQKLTFGIKDKNGDWLAVASGNVTATQYVAGASVNYIDVDAASKYINVSFLGDIDTSKTQVGLYDGNTLIGVLQNSDYSKNDSYAYLGSVIGSGSEHVGVYISNSDISTTTISGNLYIAKTLTAGKTYTLKATVDGKTIALGSVTAKNEVSVTGAYTANDDYQYDKALVEIYYDNISADDLVVKLYKNDVEIAKTESVIPWSQNESFHTLNISPEDASGALIKVYDKKNNLLYSGSVFSVYPCITDCYYDYDANQVVAVTTDIPDGTVVTASIDIEDKTYTATARVSGNHVRLSGFKSGNDTLDLLKTNYYYYLEFSYTVNKDDLDDTDYLYVDADIQRESTYSSFSPSCVDAGVTSFPVTIQLSKNAVDVESGNFTAQLYTSDGTKVGSEVALTASNATLGNNKIAGYELTGTWSGSALAVDNYTLVVSRGGEAIRSYSVYALATDKVYASLYHSTIGGKSYIEIYVPSSINREYDMSKFSLNAFDFVGNPANVSISLATEYQYKNAKYYSFTILDTSLTGVKFTASYDGKPVFDYYNCADNEEEVYYYVPSNESGVRYYTNSDGIYGLYLNAPATVQIREVGTMNVSKTFELTNGGQWNYFTTDLLSGLNYNNKKTEYNITVKTNTGSVTTISGVYLAVESTSGTTTPTPTPAPSNENEQVTAFVARMYSVALNRQPSNNEDENWVNDLLSHTKNGADVANGFIMSQEFSNRKLSNEDFVDVLYQSFLGRAADEGGKADWVGKLEEGYTRRYVLRGFVNSAEFDEICASYGIDRGELVITAEEEVPQAIIDEEQVTAFVKRMYEKALGREGEADGIASWVSRIMAREWEAADVATTGFFFSPEFINKETSNEVFVETLYEALFDRASDPDGKAYWLDKIASEGYTREQVMKGFTESQEFYNMLKQFGLR